jgi:hypothetical protein
VQQTNRDRCLAEQCLTAFGTAEHRGRKKERENAKERAGNIEYNGRQKYDNSVQCMGVAIWRTVDYRKKKLQKKDQIIMVAKNLAA